MRRTTSRPGTRSALGAEANAVNATSATSAREIHRPLSSSKTASVYSIAVHASSGIAEIAALTLGSERTVTETCAPARIAASTAGRP